MTRSRTHSRSRCAGLVAPVLTAVLLVLGTPASASAQCADPNYRGSRTFPGGSCPETVADTASTGVWVLVLLAAGTWLAYALSRSRSTTDADLATVDATFAKSTPADPDEPVRPD
ncbi:hypothetical protein [Streptomyces ehimensis]|uniref:Secreted protein n=1 Tax=Streptomyces ehimensis TaxID=68195 RepID=A0ABV9BTX4_9ACTN